MLPHWLTNLVPIQGATLQDEIKCYSLPYGGIGFLSHLLTYYTILCLCWLRRPYFRCRQSWEFILIAVWRFGLSLTVGWWSLYASVSTLATTRASKFGHPREELGLKPEEDLDVMPQLWNLKEDIRKHLPKQDHKSQEKTRVARQYTIGGASWLNAGRIVNAGSEHMTNVQEAEYKQAEVNLWLPGLQKRLEDLHIKVRTSRSWVPGMEPIRRFFERHYSKYQRLRADEATQMIEEEKENVKKAVEKLYKALRFAKIDLEAGLPPPEKPNPFHLMIYLVFCVIGVVGHAALVVRAEQAESIDQNRLQSVNLAFGFIIALSTVPGFLPVWLGASEGVAGMLLGFFSWIVNNLFIFTAFWSDWLLAVIADDLVGIPSGDVAPMYWAYFAAKRLPFLIS